MGAFARAQEIPKIPRMSGHTLGIFFYFSTHRIPKPLDGFFITGLYVQTATGVTVREYKLGRGLFHSEGDAAAVERNLFRARRAGGRAHERHYDQNRYSHAPPPIRDNL